ncbi:geraniol 10-hydroxylase-like protein [Tanacetum coccineum]
MELVGKPNLVDFFPVLKRIDPQGIRRRMTENCGKVLEIFEGLINERFEMRKNKNGVQGEHDDIREILLNDSQQKHEELNLSQRACAWFDLFVAGTDTTASTLEWAMTEVLVNPHIMAKAKDELSQVIGKGKILDENDVLRLPYLQNIVKETLRIQAPVPLLLLRKIQRQIELNGYDPQGYTGIDVQGCEFEFIIPFDGGRRICPGLAIAIRMIPMMLGSLLNNFDWKLECGIGSNELDLTEKFGLTLQKAEPLRAIPMCVAKAFI